MYYDIIYFRRTNAFEYARYSGIIYNTRFMNETERVYLTTYDSNSNNNNIITIICALVHGYTAHTHARTRALLNDDVGTALHRAYICIGMYSQCVHIHVLYGLYVLYMLPEIDGCPFLLLRRFDDNNNNIIPTRIVYNTILALGVNEKSAGGYAARGIPGILRGIYLLLKTRTARLGGYLFINRADYCCRIPAYREVSNSI